MSASWSWKSSSDNAVVRKTEDGLEPLTDAVLSINNDFTEHQHLIAGTNISIVDSGHGNHTINNTSAGGITSINADVTPAQTIVGVGSITVTNDGVGDHLISINHSGDVVNDLIVSNSSFYNTGADTLFLLSVSAYDTWSCQGTYVSSYGIGMTNTSRYGPDKSNTIGFQWDVGDKFTFISNQIQFLNGDIYVATNSNSGSTYGNILRCSRLSGTQLLYAGCLLLKLDPATPIPIPSGSDIIVKPTPYEIPGPTDGTVSYIPITAVGGGGEVTTGNIPQALRAQASGFILGLLGALGQSVGPVFSDVENEVIDPVDKVVSDRITSDGVVETSTSGYLLPPGAFSYGHTDLPPSLPRYVIENHSIGNVNIYRPNANVAIGPPITPENPFLSPLDPPEDTPFITATPGTGVEIIQSVADIPVSQLPLGGPGANPTDIVAQGGAWVARLQTPSMKIPLGGGPLGTTQLQAQSINPNSVLPLSHQIDYSMPILRNSNFSKYTGSVPYPTFAPSPTLVLTPNFAGYYRVYAQPTFTCTTGSNRYSIEATTGNANQFCQNTGGMISGGGLKLILTQTVESWYTLQAGATYHFDIGGFSNGNGIALQSQFNDGTTNAGAMFNIWAEEMKDAFEISPPFPGNSSNLTTTSSFVSFAGTGYPLIFTFNCNSTALYKVYTSLRVAMNTSMTANLEIVHNSGLVSQPPIYRTSSTTTHGVNMNDTFYVESIFGLVNGRTYTFELLGKVSTGSMSLAPFTGGGGNNFMFAEEVPTLSMSSTFSSDVAVTSTTYAAFSGVSWDFNPAFTGTHKFTAMLPIENTNNAAGNYVTAQLNITSGAQFQILSTSEGTVSIGTTATPMKTCLITMLALVQAGATYTIFAQGRSLPAGAVTLKGTVVPFFFTAEQVFLSGIQSINGDFNPQQKIVGLDIVDVSTSNGATAISIPNPINPFHGGTGLSGLTAHNVLVGEDFANVNLVPPSTAGFILTSNGPSADPSFQAVPAGGSVTSVSSSAPAFLTDTVTNPTTTPNIALTLSGTPLQITNTASTGTQEISLTNTNTNATLETGFGAFADGGTSIEMVASSTTHANRGIIRTAANAGLDMNAQGTGKSIRLQTNGVSRLTLADTGGLVTDVAIPVASGGTGDTTLTAHSVLVGNTTSAMAQVGPSATSGLPLLSQGVSANPSFAALSLSTSTSVTGTLPVNHGGTGVTTLSSGNVLGGNGTSAMISVPYDTLGNPSSLMERDVNGNVIASTFIPSLQFFPASNQTVDLSDLSTGQFFYIETATGTNVTFTLPPVLSLPQTGYYYIFYNNSNATVTIQTSTAVTLIVMKAAVLPGSVGALTPYSPGVIVTNIANVNNNANSWNVSSINETDVSNNTYLPGTTNVTSLIATNAIPVSSGGTGQATLSAHDVLIGNGTSGVTQVSPSTAGFILTSNGTSADPSFQAVPAGGSVTSVGMTVPTAFSVSGSPVTTSGTLAVTYSGTAIPVTSGGTGQTTLSSGQFLKGNGTSAVTSVASTGSGNVVLATSATLVTPALGTPSAVDLSNATNVPINNATGGPLTVTNGGTGVATLTTGQLLVGHGTSNVTGQAFSSTPSTGTIPHWDTNSNLHANGLVFGYETFSGNTTLTAADAQYLYLTGSAAILTLPTGTSVGVGWVFYIISTAAWTVNDASAATIGATTANRVTTLLCQATESPGTWLINNPSSTSGTVTSVGVSMPSAFSVASSPVTSSGTIAVTYSGTAIPVTSGGTGVATLTSGQLVVGAGTGAVTAQSFGSTATASDILQRDSNANVLFNNFIPNVSTNSGGGTTTLTASSSPYIIVTTNPATYNLPTGTAAGVGFTFSFLTSTTLTVQNSTASVSRVYNAPSSSTGTYSTVIVTCTVTGSPGTWNFYQPPTNGPYGFPLVANLTLRATTTATAAGTTTLFNTDNHYRIFTGSSSQTVKLPTCVPGTTTGGVVGTSYTILNQSTQSLTIQTNNATALTTQPSSSIYQYLQIGTTDAAASWQIIADGGTGTVTSVDMTVPSFLSISGNPITSSGTLAVSLSGTALPVANGGTGATTFTSGRFLTGAGTSAVTTTASTGSGNVVLDTNPTLNSVTINGLATSNSTYYGLGYRTEVDTATTTSTLTNLSGSIQNITGSSLVLTCNNSYEAGRTMTFINNSGTACTVKANDASVISVVRDGAYLNIVNPSATPTTNTSWNILSTIAPPSITRYTTAGSFTYTVPVHPSPLYLIVELLGAGGGGGASTNGSGGAGGNGADSTFGSTAVAKGGIGGPGGGSSANPDTFPTNTTDYVTLQDVPGSIAVYDGGFTASLAGAGFPVVGLDGHDSIYGIGGGGGLNTYGRDARGYGAGGAAGAPVFGSSLPACAGGCGGYLKFQVERPLSSTYAVVTGAAGAAGTGGSWNGGMGSIGYCIVTAYTS